MWFIIIVLLASRLFSYAITHMLTFRGTFASFRAYRFLFLNIVLNTVFILISDLFFLYVPSRSIGALLLQYRQFVTLSCSYQDVLALIKASAADLCLSALLGVILGLIYGRKSRSRTVGSRWAGVFLCSACWGLILVLGYSMTYRCTDLISITEVCRELTAADDHGDEPVCRIVLKNNGTLACTLNGLYISETEALPEAYPVENVTVPAQGSYAYATVCSHGPDFNKASETAIYLFDADGDTVDQVTVPPLESDETYRLEEDGTWSVLRRAEDDAWVKVIPAPVFSQKSGFYDEDFQLSITSDEGCQIYYTLDGSEPDEDALPYVGPLSVTDASPNENTISMRTDVSTGFLEDLISRTVFDAPGYRAPDKPVDKCTVIKAIATDADGNRSATSCAAYFVDFNDKTGYEGMYTLSLVTDPANLFDYERGIYVTGKAFDEFLAGDPGDLAELYWWWNANYRLKGREYERPAHVELYDAEHKLLEAKDIGIRIQGGGSRGLLPRSLTLYARKEYDGEAFFRQYIFGTTYAPQRMILFSGADGNIQKIQDYLLASLTSGMNFSTMSFVPCTLFLNGEYWGVYWLTERYDEEYISYHYGVDDQNIIMIKTMDVSEGEPEEYSVFSSATSYVIYNDMTDDRCYAHACELFDMDSLIDYYCTRIYISRFNDWPGANFAAWRARETGEGPYEDGRWRWMLFDDNSGAFELSLAEEDSLARIRDTDLLFGALMKNPGFSKAACARLIELADERFEPSKVSAFIDAYISSMSEPLLKEYSRFYGSGNTVYEDRFIPVLEDIATFFNKRYTFVKNYYGQMPGDTETQNE